MKPRYILLAVFLMLVIGAVLAISHTQDEGQEETSQVRVVHMSPGLQDVSVFIDGERKADGVGFGQASVYQEVDTGDREIQVAPAGAGVDQELAATRFTFEEGESYTVVVTDRGFSPGVEVIQDDPQPQPGQSQFRVAQFSPDLLEVDVVIEDGPLRRIDGIPYRSSSGYQSIEPGSYSLRVEDAPGREVFTGDVSLEEDATYTLFVAGARGAPQGLQVVPVIDSPEPVEPEPDNDVHVDDREFLIECRIVEQ